MAPSGGVVETTEEASSRPVTAEGRLFYNLFHFKEETFVP